eukprot:gene5872-6791_t
MKTDVKIVLIGDEGVGKTTIISSFVSDSFVENVQKVVPEATIPAEVLGHTCATRIIDTCDADEQHQGRGQMNLELKRCDAIVLVYSSQRLDSFFNIRTKWMPLIKQIRSGDPVPIVIVGNKSDLINEADFNKNIEQMEETMMLISNDYAGSIRWMQCSAATMENVHEVLDCAQSFVLFPEKTLYNRQNNTLTNGCEQALRRIFQICDLDNDGALNDLEINYYHQRCSHDEMSSEDISELKKFLRTKMPNGVDANGFTVDGFLYMNLLFLAKGPQHTWLTIRSFRYDDNLVLKQEYLQPNLSVPTGCHVELSNEGIEFLKQWFQRFDSDSDGVLSEKDLTKMFGPTPGIPWGKSFRSKVTTSDNGDLLLSGYLSLWNLQTFEDHTVTLKYFAYFGYDSILKSDTTHLVKVVKTRDPSKQQTLFNCYVFGSNACGKLHEHINGEKIIQSNKLMERCDGICLMFDESVSDSFDVACSLFKLIRETVPHIPVCFVRGCQLVDVHTTPKTTLDAFFHLTHITPKEFTVATLAENQQIDNQPLYKSIIESIEKGSGVTKPKVDNAGSTAVMMLAGGSAVGAGLFLLLKHLNSKK